MSKDAKKVMPDLKTFGNGNLFKLIARESSEDEGWIKSTRVMNIERLGCALQVSTQLRDQVAEAICFVPGAQVFEKDDNDCFIIESIVDVSKREIPCPNCQGEGIVATGYSDGPTEKLIDVSCDLCFGSGKLLVEPVIQPNL